MEVTHNSAHARTEEALATPFPHKHWELELRSTTRHHARHSCDTRTLAAGAKRESKRTHRLGISRTRILCMPSHGDVARSETSAAAWRQTGNNSLSDTCIQNWLVCIPWQTSSRLLQTRSPPTPRVCESPCTTQESPNATVRGLLDVSAAHNTLAGRSPALACLDADPGVPLTHTHTPRALVRHSCAEAFATTPRSAPPLSFPSQSAHLRTNAERARASGRPPSTKPGGSRNGSRALQAGSESTSPPHAKSRVGAMLKHMLARFDVPHHRPLPLHKDNWKSLGAKRSGVRAAKVMRWCFTPRHERRHMCLPHSLDNTMPPTADRPKCYP